MSTTEYTRTLQTPVIPFPEGRRFERAYGGRQTRYLGNAPMHLLYQGTDPKDLIRIHDAKREQDDDDAA